MDILFLESEQLYADLLPAGLKQIGCTVKTVTEVLNGELERALSEFKPDFALTMGWSYFPTQERLEAIRRVADEHDLPLVFWSIEDPCWHEQYSVPYVQTLKPNLVLTICSEYVDRYQAMGVPAACLPFGYNHELYRPVPAREEYACDIALVANFYTARYDELNRKRSVQTLLAPLLERGYNLKVWGANWDQAAQFGIELPPGVWQGYLSHREAPAVYNSAKIVLGLQNEFDFETNLTMRTFEIMGSGGFLLTSRTKAVEGLFEHGEHLVMSASPAETVALVDYYLAQPQERERIAAAGQAEVRSQHTYAHRALELLPLAEEHRDSQPMLSESRHEGCFPPFPYCPCCCCCPCDCDCCGSESDDSCSHRHDCSGSESDDSSSDSDDCRCSDGDDSSSDSDDSSRPLLDCLGSNTDDCEE